MKWLDYCVHIFGIQISISGLIKEIGILVFIMASAFLIPTSDITALVLAGCASILAALRYYDKLWKRIKIIIAAIAPVTIAVIVAYILIHYLWDATSQQLINLVIRIATIVMIAPIIFERTYSDRHGNAIVYLLRDYRLSVVQKAIYRLLRFLYRIIIILGFVLTIIYEEKLCACVTVIGCIVWVVYSIIAHYYWRNCVPKDVAIDYESVESTPQKQNAGGCYADEPISQRDIERIVQKIADRWTGREDTSLFVSGGGSIRFNVTVEVVGGTFINYTVNGKLLGVREEQLSTAYTLLGGKIDKVAFKITEETKNELAKHKLEYSSYDIKVIKGSIE